MAHMFYTGRTASYTCFGLTREEDREFIRWLAANLQHMPTHDYQFNAFVSAYFEDGQALRADDLARWNGFVEDAGGETFAIVSKEMDRFDDYARQAHPVRGAERYTIFMDAVAEFGVPVPEDAMA